MPRASTTKRTTPIQLKGALMINRTISAKSASEKKIVTERSMIYSILSFMCRIPYQLIQEFSTISRLF